MVRQTSEVWDCSTPWTRQRSSEQPSNLRQPPQPSATRPTMPSPKTNPRHVFVSAAAVSRTRLSVGRSPGRLSIGQSRVSPPRSTPPPPSRSQIPPLRSAKSKIPADVHQSMSKAMKVQLAVITKEINDQRRVCVFFLFILLGIQCCDAFQLILMCIMN